MGAASALGQSKRAKYGEDGDADGGSYQLGDFPDAILHRILSLLPIEDAVAMSSLSKRWQRLWLSIPTLFLEQDDFPGKEVFMSFVERTLLLHDSSSLEDVNLSCYVDSHASRINSWIASIISRNVRDLTLWLGVDRQLLVLPYCLFRSGTLVKLRLVMEGDLVLPSSICLSSLKYLALEFVWIKRYRHVQNLLSSCPALEDLSLYECHWMDQKDVTISAPNLRTLSVHDDCEHSEEDRDCCSRKVVFHGPNVNFFSYSGIVTHKYYLAGSSSLIKTRLSFEKPDYLLGSTGGFSHLMEGLRKVKSLTLSAEFFQKGSPDGSSEEDQFEDLPIFCNMTELKLDKERVFLGSRRLANLLRKCPLLSILEIAEGLTGNTCQALEPVPPCLETQLRKIVVRRFSPTKESVDCAALLLSKALALEEMVLYYHEGTTEEAYKFSDLKKLLRRSKKCRISLIL